MKIFVSSQIRRYQKFIADKNIHSWRRIGSPPIPTAGGDAKLKIAIRARGNDAATDKPCDGSHTWMRSLVAGAGSHTGIIFRWMGENSPPLTILLSLKSTVSPSTISANFSFRSPGQKARPISRISFSIHQENPHHCPSDASVGLIPQWRQYQNSPDNLHPADRYCPRYARR